MAYKEHDLTINTWREKQNRGIGQAICKLILSRPDVTPLKLFAASRKGEDIGFSPSTDSGREVLYPKLDVSSRESIAKLAEEVKREGLLVDVLINNAGVNLDARYGYENARTTLDVNYKGVREVGGESFILLLLMMLFIFFFFFSFLLETCLFLLNGIYQNRPSGTVVWTRRFPANILISPSVVFPFCSYLPE